jgi:RNA polymerase sigma-70 factor, ECF subfamily
MEWQELLEQLYREHRVDLVRLVERRTGDRDEAEDIVQAAFLAAHRELRKGTRPRNPWAWLATIALNGADRLHRKPRPAPLEDYFAVWEENRVPDVRRALDALPESQRAAFLYRELAGLSYAETATRMGVTVGSVQMLLHRARASLRARLAPVYAAAAWIGRWGRQIETAGPVARSAIGAVAVIGLAAGGFVAAEHASPARGGGVVGLAPALSAVGASRAAPVRVASAKVPAGLGRAESAALLPSSDPSTVVGPDGRTAWAGATPVATGEIAIPGAATVSGVTHELAPAATVPTSVTVPGVIVPVPAPTLITTTVPTVPVATLITTTVPTVPAATLTGTVPGVTTVGLTATTPTIP